MKYLRGDNLTTTNKRRRLRLSVWILCTLPTVRVKWNSGNSLKIENCLVLEKRIDNFNGEMIRTIKKKVRWAGSFSFCNRFGLILEFCFPRLVEEMSCFQLSGFLSFAS